MKNSAKRILIILLTFTMTISNLSFTGMEVNAAQSTPKSIKLNTKKKSMSIGSKLKLKVKSVKPKKASKAVKWQSSNKKIATVNSKGVVRAKSSGKVTIKTISKKSKKVTAKCKITVYKNTKKLALRSKKKYTKTVHDTFKVTAKVTKPKKGAAPVKWSSSNKKVASITKSGKVKCLNAGKTTLKAVSGKKKVKISLTVNSKPKKNETESKEVPSITPDTYTRAEWVSALADKLEMNMETGDGDLQYYYADTEGTTYGKAVEIAYNYGILPPPDSEGFIDPDQDIPYFEGDRVATREFVAYTVVHAMGFEGDYSIDCKDSASIKYPAVASIAVNQGLLKLSNGSFLPETPYARKDTESLFKTIDQLKESLFVDPNNMVDHVEFQEGIMAGEFEDCIDYFIVSENDNIYEIAIRVSDAVLSLDQGDIFVLPANKDNPQGLALRVMGVGTVKEEYRYLTCTVPEAEEVLSDIEFEGYGKANVDHVEPSSGVGYEYIPEESNAKPRADIDAGGTVAVPGSLKFSVNKSLNENLKAEGSVTIQIPEVTCKVKAQIGLISGVNLEELVISIREKIKFQGSLSCTLLETGYELTNSNGDTRFSAGRIELGRVPIQLGASGLSIDIVFFYTVSAKGSASVTYSIDAKQGVQYVNGNFRVIKDFSQSFDQYSFMGSAKAGVGIAVLLNAFSLMDLIGINGQAGLGASISYTKHVTDPILYCGGGTLYLYASLELDTETAFGVFLKKVLHMSWSWDIFDASNSPLKLGFHMENGSFVDACTYGSGHISGLVLNADDTKPLKNARVQVCNGSNIVKTVYTDSKGEYSLKSLDANDYSLKISATGFYLLDVNVKVRKNETTYIESALLIDRNGSIIPEGHGVISGNITDALTGEPVDGVAFKVMKGWNKVDDESVEEGVSGTGDYNVTLPVGSYTLVFSKDEYIDSFINVIVLESRSRDYHIAISPESAGSLNGIVRIVLTWGQYPRDLDSHLFGPTVDGQDYFHTNWWDQDYYEENELIANLDLDDISSYGPETTTIYKKNNSGIYSFYVHDYTNRKSKNSYELSNSGANVKVYSGVSLVANFNVPANTGGTFWHVFDYDASIDTLKGVNVMSYNDDPSIWSRSIDSDSSNYLNDISNLPNKEI